MGQKQTSIWPLERGHVLNSFQGIILHFVEKLIGGIDSCATLDSLYQMFASHNRKDDREYLKTIKATITIAFHKNQMSN